MRVVVQRVAHAGVTVEGCARVSIGPGLLVLLGVRKEDTEEDARWLAQKVLGMRLFEDDQRKMNRSVGEVGGEILVISQFTLYGDCHKGRRPSFDKAAPPPVAIPLYECFIKELSASGLGVRQGRFGAKMDVDLVNCGPVTLIVDSPQRTASSPAERMSPNA